MASGHERHRRKKHQPGWAGFRGDLKAGCRHLWQRTSTNHKRFVLVALLLGTVLRVLRMNEPVTYDEAVTYVDYAGHSFAFLFSDLTSMVNHILYSALSRVSILLFGVGLWSLRLPALLAGLLVMPLGYAFVRQVFNRHIAVIFLCFIAASGPLIEYSAMARGYSLVWFFTLCALLASRHFVKTENMISAALLALSCALGMWAAPAMTYPALMVYAWTAFLILANYESTVRRRLLKLLASWCLAFALAALCYLPVVLVHSVDHLVHHPSTADNTWARFLDTNQDRVFDLWAYFTDTTSSLLSVLGVMAIGYAAYVSLKYRLLLGALVLGAVPLAVVLHVVAPPATWTYSLLVFHLGGAIGLFYLLKTLRDKLAPNFGKDQRTLVAGLAVLLVFGWLGYRGKPDDVERFPDAGKAAEWLVDHGGHDDRLCVQSPWDAPMDFYLARADADLRVVREAARPTGRLLILVAPGHGQTPRRVLMDAGMMPPDGEEYTQLQSWGRLELFGAK